MASKQWRHELFILESLDAERPDLDLKDLSVMLFRTVFMRSSRDLFMLFWLTLGPPGKR